jgi:hypothetical protein
MIGKLGGLVALGERVDAPVERYKNATEATSAIAAMTTVVEDRLDILPMATKHELTSRRRECVGLTARSVTDVHYSNMVHDVSGSVIRELSNGSHHHRQLSVIQISTHSNAIRVVRTIAHEALTT